VGASLPRVLPCTPAQAVRQHGHVERRRGRTAEATNGSLAAVAIADGGDRVAGAGTGGRLGNGPRPQPPPASAWCGQHQVRCRLSPAASYRQSDPHSVHRLPARSMDSPVPIFELVSSVVRAATPNVAWPDSFLEAMRALFRWLPAGVDASTSKDLAAAVSTAALARIGTPGGQAFVELIASAMEQPEFAADSATLETWTDALAVRCIRTVLRAPSRG